MTEDEARAAVVQGLLAKAEQALAAAERECAAGDLGLATNRVYYACFYALSAVLLQEKMTFAKHSGVRGALHQSLVRPGRVSKDMGQFYDRAFTERQEADYNALTSFDLTAVAGRIAGGHEFVAEMKRLLGESLAKPA